jgi:uroporphyrinogen decarboxylase
MKNEISGKENYTKVIEFKSPSYIPCKVKVNFDWIKENDSKKVQRIKELQSQIKDDILADIHVAKNLKEPFDSDGKMKWIDEWGTGWIDDGFGAKTEGYPLIDGYDLLDTFFFPDPLLESRFDEVDKILEHRNNRYVRASVWFTLFERLWMLRGFENILLDPYLETEKFCYLRDKIVDNNLAIIDLWLERNVDGIFFSDDWGSQTDLLINPKDWRKYYKPSYQKMFDRVRSGGAHVWMHLCGNITAILPDLIELGLSVLNPVQPQAMDVLKLSKGFGGKVCFYGGVDVQDTLIKGTPEDVKKEVHNLVGLFGKFNGGYIGDTSHSIMPETPLDNIIALYEAFIEYQ